MLVDAGPLVALIEPTDRHHLACVKALKAMQEPLMTVWPAFTEAMYLVGRSPRSVAALWGIVASGGLDFAPLSADDGPGLQSLMHRYQDQPMDLADAALVHVAARDGLRDIFTLDRRHFGVYRIGQRGRLSIVP